MQEVIVMSSVRKASSSDSQVLQQTQVFDLMLHSFAHKQPWNENTTIKRQFTKAIEEIGCDFLQTSFLVVVGFDTSNIGRFFWHQNLHQLSKTRSKLCCHLRKSKMKNQRKLTWSTYCLCITFNCSPSLVASWTEVLLQENMFLLSCLSFHSKPSKRYALN